MNSTVPQTEGSGYLNVLDKGYELQSSQNEVYLMIYLITYYLVQHCLNVQEGGALGQNLIILKDDKD